MYHMAKRYGQIGQAALMNAIAALEGGTTAGASPADGKKKTCQIRKAGFPQEAEPRPAEDDLAL
jgi:hypothetical protein